MADALKYAGCFPQALSIVAKTACDFKRLLPYNMLIKSKTNMFTANNTVPALQVLAMDDHDAGPSSAWVSPGGW